MIPWLGCNHVQYRERRDREWTLLTPDAVDVARRDFVVNFIWPVDGDRSLFSSIEI